MNEERILRSYFKGSVKWPMQTVTERTAVLKENFGVPPAGNVDFVREEHS